MSFSPRRLTQQFVESLIWNGKRTFIRDSDLKGFMVVVNKTSKSYMVQRDVWRGTRGNKKLLGPRRPLIGRVGVISLKEAREKARGVIAQMARGEEPNAEQQRAAGPTLREALQAYLDLLKRKNKSPHTVKGYKYNMEHYLADWLDESLAVIGKDRKAVRDRHKHLTEKHGPHTANATLRSLRAIYRYERQVNPQLPECPVNSRDFNAEARREKFVALTELFGWKAKVDKMENPIRRDLQLFLLFTAMRRTAACEARWEDFDEFQRTLRVPRPKGGQAKAFKLPLSGFILELLRRRRAENAVLFPNSPWIFPSISRTGCIAESKQRGLPSAHVLRHSYATHAISAGVPWADLQVLLNHAPPCGVTGGYVHEHGLLERLREQQEKITAFLLEHMRIDKQPGCVSI